MQNVKCILIKNEIALKRFNCNSQTQFYQSSLYAPNINHRKVFQHCVQKIRQKHRALNIIKPAVGIV